MEQNNIYLGDCLEIMKSFPDESVDCIITSPPYDNLRQYNKTLLWNNEIWEKTILEFFRIIKQGGIVVWVVGDAVINGSETGSSFRQALFFLENGFNLHDTMIYKKKSMPFPENVRYFQCFEYMFVFSKGKPKTFNPIRDRENKRVGEVKNKLYWRNSDGLCKTKKKQIIIKPFGTRTNIWEYNIGWQHSYKEDFLRKHPAIFPFSLAQDHVISWTNENDIILDPFLGSGTTAIACINTNRNYIGIEKNIEYYNIALRRIKEFKKTEEDKMPENNKKQLNLF